MEEIFQYILQTLGPWAASIGICLSYMKTQESRDEKMTNFMLDQIEKQTMVLDKLNENIKCSNEQILLLKEEIEGINEKLSKEDVK